jgi:thiosulfate/3-mercaptopyruvate sulfurtransferase
MLMGPRDQWAQAGHEWSTEVPKPAASAHPPVVANAELLASREAVQDATGDPAQILLDVRATPEYSGELFWPSGATADAGRAGHLPGAVSVPIDLRRTEDGTLNDPEELRHILEQAGVTKDKAVITYCTIGNRASEAWFALRYLLDYPRRAGLLRLLGRVGKGDRQANRKLGPAPGRYRARRCCR